MTNCETCLSRKSNQGLYIGIAVSAAVHLVAIVTLMIFSEKPKPRVIDIGEITIRLPQKNYVIRSREI